MKITHAAVLVLAPASLLVASPLAAKGCIRGAVVGAVAGHYAHHHAIAGAAAGCVAGHMYYKHKANVAAQQNAQHKAPQPAEHPQH